MLRYSAASNLDGRETDFRVQRRGEAIYIVFDRIGRAMIAPNEFWLRLHQLAEAYRAEGLTPEERSANIISEFAEMPPIAQREVLADLRQITDRCPDLYPLATAAAKDSERRRSAV